MKDWEPGGPWYMSWISKAPKPEALMSKGRRKSTSQLRTGGATGICLGFPRPQNQELWCPRAGENQHPSSRRERKKELACPPPSCFTQALRDWMMFTHTGEGRFSSFHPLSQMVISSGMTLTDTPKSNVLSRHCLAQLVQFSSVAQSCPTLCNPMNCSTPGLPVHLQLLESKQTHVHRVSDAIQPSHPFVVSYSSCPQSFPASGSFQMSQLFASGGQSIGISASTSVLPMNTQDWSPLGWTGWISFQSKGLSRVFSNTTVQMYQFVSAQLSL